MNRLILIAALALTGCASLGGPRHVTTVSVVTADATLSALHDGEQGLVCGLATAPAKPACVTAAQHKVISGYFVTAFDVDGQIARTVRPVGQPLPASMAELVGQLATLIDKIFAAIPKSPQRASLIERMKGAK